MKKLVILSLLSLFFSDSVNAQPTVRRNRGEYYLYNDKKYTDTESYETIEVNEKPIACRKFFYKTKVTSEEYLHLEKDTFLFTQYDSIEHKVLTQGKLVPSQQVCAADTILTVNPDTYEENLSILEYPCWKKEGFWKEKENNSRTSGRYENGKKIDEWFTWDLNTNKGRYSFYDKKGILLYEEPYNVIDTHDKVKINEQILGTWGTYGIYEFTRVLSPEGKGYNHGLSTLVFEKNRVVFNLRGYDSAADAIGTWRIENNNRLIIEGIKWYSEQYDISFLSRYELMLIPVKK